MSKSSYKDAGVDIEAGEEAVDRIKKTVKNTFNKNVLAEIGGFGGLYHLDLEKWKNPVLVSSVDGVGTKLIIAEMMKKYDTVGQDLVNHCVNDIFVQGASPQFFMDYIGVGKLHPQKMEEIVKGFSQACIENNMSLIGGEMAEMPGIYQDDDFDLAGMIVGLVEKDKILTGNKIKEGNIVLGLSSNGLHTNGYSLARKIVFDILKLKLNKYIDELEASIGSALLKVHKSYYPILKESYEENLINGMAHITGGGIEGNLKRVIPDGLTADIDVSTWTEPPLFGFLRKSGKIEKKEMFKTFNMGIGMIVIVDKEDVDKVKTKVKCFEIGRIVKKSKEKVRLINV